MVADMLENKWVESNAVSVSYHAYSSEEQWLEARGHTAGATDLSRWLLSGSVPKNEPITDDFVKAIFEFGHEWEQPLFDAYANENRLEIVSTSTPIMCLRPGQAAWHDASFYEIGGLIHASLDGVVCTNDGHRSIVEIKTGKAKSIEDMSPYVLRKYIIQMYVEMLASGADGMVLVYGHRPDDFIGMKNASIREELLASMESKTITRSDLNDVVLHDGRRLSSITLGDVLRASIMLNETMDKTGVKDE